MRTVLFTHPSAELYGADRTLLHAVRATVRVGRHAVVALPRRGVLADELERLGAVVEIGTLGAAMRADLSPARFPAFLRQAREGARFVAGLIERHSVDLVHTNTSVLVGAARGAARSGVPHVWHVHEILDEPAWARATMRAALTRWSDVVLANSEATARAMTPRGFDGVRVLHNGFEPERFARRAPVDRAALEDRFGLPRGKRLVVLPGRINAWKGQRLLVEALGRARELSSRVHVAIVGDPPSGQEHFGVELTETIARHGLESTVSVLPFTDDLPELLRAAELCVVPSTKPEPFGLVALEAMASGTAVLAAGHGGLPEIVEAGTTGELFFPGSVDDLAERLVRMLDPRVDLFELGANGRERARRCFSLEAHEAGIVGLQDELIAGRGARRAA
ncbi:MAG: glycosyltransferase family 4 protein [Planctomycetota bacterium]